jgi:hypothetical protein
VARFRDGLDGGAGGGGRRRGLRRGQRARRQVRQLHHAALGRNFRVHMPPWRGGRCELRRRRRGLGVASAARLQALQLLCDFSVHIRPICIARKAQAPPCWHVKQVGLHSHNWDRVVACIAYQVCKVGTSGEAHGGGAVNHRAIRRGAISAAVRADLEFTLQRSAAVAIGYQACASLHMSVRGCIAMQVCIDDRSAQVTHRATHGIERSTRRRAGAHSLLSRGVDRWQLRDGGQRRAACLQRRSSSGASCCCYAACAAPLLGYNLWRDQACTRRSADSRCAQSARVCSSTLTEEGPNRVGTKQKGELLQLWCTALALPLAHGAQGS